MKIHKSPGLTLPESGPFYKGAETARKPPPITRTHSYFRSESAAMALLSAMAALLSAFVKRD